MFELHHRSGAHLRRKACVTYGNYEADDVDIVVTCCARWMPGNLVNDAASSLHVTMLDLQPSAEWCKARSTSVLSQTYRLDLQEAADDRGCPEDFLHTAFGIAQCSRAEGFLRNVQIGIQREVLTDLVFSDISSVASWTSCG